MPFGYLIQVFRARAPSFCILHFRHPSQHTIVSCGGFRAQSYVCARLIDAVAEAVPNTFKRLVLIILLIPLANLVIDLYLCKHNPPPPSILPCTI